MSKRLRIAIYHNLLFGGAKRTLYEEAKCLSATHQLDLFSLSSADNDFGDVRSFVRNSWIHSFEPGQLFRSPFGRLNQGVRLIDLARLRRLSQHIAADIDAGGYDVVLVHPCQYTQSPLVLQFLRTPTAYYCQEPLRRLYESPPPRPYGRHSPLKRALDKVDLLDALYRAALCRADRSSLRNASRVLVNSRFTQEKVRRIYGVESQVCLHGVDTELFRPLNLPRDEMLLSVGALTPNKGFDFIIESLGHVAESIRPELVIVSNYQEPQERAYLESLAAGKQVRLTMLTMIKVDELVRLYNTAYATVCAQVLEPFGLVPLESMACGTPVVAVAEGGLRESLTDGHTGLLVNRDPHEFAAAVERLLTDSSFAERLGQQGRADACERWAWERSIRQLEGYLERTVQDASVTHCDQRMTLKKAGG